MRRRRNGPLHPHDINRRAGASSRGGDPRAEAMSATVPHSISFPIRPRVTVALRCKGPGAHGFDGNRYECVPRLKPTALELHRAGARRRRGSRSAPTLRASGRERASALQFDASAPWRIPPACHLGQQHDCETAGDDEPWRRTESGALVVRRRQLQRERRQQQQQRGTHSAPEQSVARRDARRPDADTRR